MKKMRYGLVCAVLLSCVALGQMAKPEPKSVADVLNNGLKQTEGEFVPAADAMPEDKYSFAPSNGEFKGVRTFAQQVKHVAAVNYIVGATILGEKPPVDVGGESGPEAMKSKADIMKFLKDSFEYAHKATASIDEKNMITPVKSPFGNGQTTRLGMATLFAAHAFDHYGQMVEYLRMNGIVPPASRQ